MMPTEQADRIAGLVERLRGDGSSWAQPLFNEAADALTALQARVGELEKNLESRDTWIVSKGLWSEFVDSLPTTPPAPHSDEAGS